MPFYADAATLAILSYATITMLPPASDIFATPLLRHMRRFSPLRCRRQRARYIFIDAADICCTCRCRAATPCYRDSCRCFFRRQRHDCFRRHHRAMLRMRHCLLMPPPPAFADDSRQRLMLEIVCAAACYYA